MLFIYLFFILSFLVLLIVANGLLNVFYLIKFFRAQKRMNGENVFDSKIIVKFLKDKENRRAQGNSNGKYIINFCLIIS